MAAVCIGSVELTDCLNLIASLPQVAFMFTVGSFSFIVCTILDYTNQNMVYLSLKVFSNSYFAFPDLKSYPCNNMFVVRLWTLLDVKIL